MKRSVLAIIVCLAISFVSQAQEVVVDNFQQLQVVFTVGDIQMGKTEIAGQTFTQLSVAGMQSSLKEGAPNLPTWSALIEVPLCTGFNVEVSGMEYDTIAVPGAVVAPLQPSRSKSDMGIHPLTMDGKIYNTNAFFAAAPLAIVEEVGVARDRNLARLQFSPISYNPVSQQLVVCKKATVTVNYKGADEQGSMDMFNRYYTPAFHSGANALNSLYPKSVSNAAPIRYVIVAHSMFRGQLDTFVQWKKRKGFITNIVYTDDAAVGSTTTSIKAYLQGLYTNATTTNPAPTFVLLVGDVDQIPAFTGTAQNSHVTDLNYCTWTSGDIIPDCYYGRFSAQTVAQLTPQIEKTLMYEQYTFADPSFLDRAVMVAGVDGGTSGDNGYTYGDPAMDYGITNYINGAHGFSNVYYYKNDTTIVPTGVTNVTVSSNGSSNAAAIRSYYNKGAGFINYSAHGSSAGWYSPSFTTTHVPSMSNNQKFGIMIGNCCQTNMFGETECFGEALLRKDNYCGAVGYIGGSQVTYWGEDFYWAVGVRSGIGPTMSMNYNANNLGVYDRSFHTHGEAYNEWATNQSSIVYYGNMAVQASGSSLSQYYWEIYHLMGDPSVMTYLTQASQMNLSVASSCPTGTTSLSVSGAAPYAYVAVTNSTDRTLMGAGFADANGSVTLTLAPLTVGNYEVVATASQYQPAYSTLTVSPAAGPYLQVVSLQTSSTMESGTTAQFTIKVKNIGTSIARNVSVTLSCDDPLLTLNTNTFNISSIGVNSTKTFIFRATVSIIANGTDATISAAATWDGTTDTVRYNTTVTLGTPYGDNFETGQFALDWQQGQYPWEITNEGATEGTRCARSCSTLTHNQTSEMTLTVDAYKVDVVSFMYRVSSEANYDKFHFYIDDEEKIVESGDGSWTYAEYPLTIGTHTLKFAYSKDNSMDRNSDCAWIDDLRVPRPAPEFTVSVTALHGTATGAGTYHMGQMAQIGVYPEAGYAFGGWNDGSNDNPRQFLVNADCALEALMTLGGTEVVYDTVPVEVLVYDTLPVEVPVYDTVPVEVPVYDTVPVEVLVYDTVPVEVLVYDTVPVEVLVYDTVPIEVSVYDTMSIEVPVYDTVQIFDTLRVYDTIRVFDTIHIFDTIYLPIQGIDSVDAMNLKVYQSLGQIVVEGAEGRQVTLFDVTGRMLAIKRDEYMPLRFDVPAIGTYIIKAGNHPARKVVVVR